MATPLNRSVLRAFALLRGFTRPDKPLTSAELSRRAGLPEASGYRLIQTLEAAGAVVRDARGRYTARVIWNFDLEEDSGERCVNRRVQDVLDRLAARFGVTVHYGVLERGMVTYLGKAVAEGGACVPTRVGAQQEAYCSAVGKALLAGLSDEELEAYLRDGDLVALTDWTITDPVLFRREIAHVRQSGFAIDRGEAYPHLSCVAVPVRNPAGQVVAAVSLVDRVERMSEERREVMRQALADAIAEMDGFQVLRSPLPRLAPCLDSLDPCADTQAVQAARDLAPLCA